MNGISPEFEHALFFSTKRNNDEVLKSWTRACPHIQLFSRMNLMLSALVGSMLEFNEITLVIAEAISHEQSTGVCGEIAIILCLS